MRQIDGRKDNALTQGDLPECRANGNPYRKMQLNRQESAEVVVTGALKCVSCEGLNMKIGD
jgi:hypothetical protein